MIYWFFDVEDYWSHERIISYPTQRGEWSNVILKKVDGQNSMWSFMFYEFVVEVKTHVDDTLETLQMRLSCSKKIPKDYVK